MEVPITGSQVSKPAIESAETVSKEQQDFHVEYDGGCMTEIHSKNCQRTRNHIDKVLNEYGKAHRNGILRRVVNSRETGMAEQCARKPNDNPESRSSSHWVMTSSQWENPGKMSIQETLRR